jgi:hypothetical protein
MLSWMMKSLAIYFGIGVLVYFWLMASQRQPNGFLLKLLTFVSTVSFWPFWGLMHLGMRKRRG